MMWSRVVLSLMQDTSRPTAPRASGCLLTERLGRSSYFSRTSDLLCQGPIRGTLQPIGLTAVNHLLSIARFRHFQTYTSVSGCEPIRPLLLFVRPRARPFGRIFFLLSASAGDAPSRRSRVELEGRAFSGRKAAGH